MAVVLSPLGGAGTQFFDSNGNPLSGGFLYTYQAGTTTPQATYTTSVGTVAHANPIVLDSAGRVPGGQIWLTVGVSYKFLLATEADVQVATWDQIEGVTAEGVPFTPPVESGFGTDVETVDDALIDLIGKIAPTGTVWMYAGTSAPNGWLFCNGSVVAIADYPLLYTIIGTAFNTGSEGDGNFRLPDFRGRVPVGVGTGSGLTARTLGARGGEETHLLTEDEMPSHTHPGIDTVWTDNIGGITANLSPGVTRFASTTGSITGSVGGDDAHNNMQPYLVLNFIIKT